LRTTIVYTPLWRIFRTWAKEAIVVNFRKYSFKTDCRRLHPVVVVLLITFFFLSTNVIIINSVNQRYSQNQRRAAGQIYAFLPTKRQNLTCGMMQLPAGIYYRTISSLSLVSKSLTFKFFATIIPSGLISKVVG